jgi:hypothetical protein
MESAPVNPGWFVVELKGADVHSITHAEIQATAESSGQSGL